jgi:hypothetical protein
MCRWCSYLTVNTHMDLHGLLRWWLYFFIHWHCNCCIKWGWNWRTHKAATFQSQRRRKDKARTFSQLRDGSRPGTTAQCALRAWYCDLQNGTSILCFCKWQEANHNQPSRFRENRYIASGPSVVSSIILSTRLCLERWSEWNEAKLSP